MANPVLHIKDSYYFEVPKLLYPYEYTRRQQFPDVWISLDPEFQDWEAERLYKELHALNADLPAKEKVLTDWDHWVHADHANFAKPLKEFLNEKYQAQLANSTQWRAAQIPAAEKEKDKQKIEQAKQHDFKQYFDNLETTHSSQRDYLPFLRWRHANQRDFERATHADVSGWKKEIQAWRDDTSVPEWSDSKIHAYNAHLSGKILIP